MPTDNFKEMLAPKWKVSDGRETRTRVFHCPWSEIETNVEELFPSSFQAGLALVRKSPTTYPGKDYLRLTDIEIDAMDADRLDAEDEDGVATSASGAKLVLTYSTHVQDVFTVGVEMSAQILRLPTSGAMQWASAIDGGKITMSIDAVSHKLIPQVVYSVQVLRVPNPDWDAIEAAIGTLNDATFFNCDAETLMYMGPTSKEVVTPDGEIAYDMTHKFQKKSIKYIGPGGSVNYAGWNHLFRPDVRDPDTYHQWQKTNPTIYETSTFANIFKLGTIDLREIVKTDAGL